MLSWLDGDWIDGLLTYGWVVWMVVLFVMGAAIGSLLNVCVARLPLEKSLLWPGSRCGHCFQPIRWYDNIPLLSYWLLRGRCRTCGARFSIGYFAVELATGLGFAGLYYLEVKQNIHHWSIFADRQQEIAAGVVPWQGWVVVGYHAVLFSFLLTAAVCDLGRREIPASLTVTGTVVGLIAALFLAWPFPVPVAEATNSLPRRGPVGQVQPTPGAAVVPLQRQPDPWWFPPRGEAPRTGLCPWPLWWPLPEWLPPGSWQLGLATSFVGLLVGTLLLRLVRFLASAALGQEALGLGDADLMMMAGGFLGWQLVVVAFFVSMAPGLLFAIVQLVVRRDNSLPFGPALAVGVMLSWLYWDRIPPAAQAVFFWPAVLAFLTITACVLLFGLSWFLRVFHR
jgi:leader peptidase (prepilin peptidase)/N-methyltransferase